MKASYWARAYAPKARLLLALFLVVGCGRTNSPATVSGTPAGFSANQVVYPTPTPIPYIPTPTPTPNGSYIPVPPVGTDYSAAAFAAGNPSDSDADRGAGTDSGSDTARSGTAARSVLGPGRTLRRYLRQQRGTLSHLLRCDPGRTELCRGQYVLLPRCSADHRAHRGDRTPSEETGRSGHHGHRARGLRTGPVPDQRLQHRG